MTNENDPLLSAGAPRDGDEGDGSDWLEFVPEAEPRSDPSALAVPWRVLVVDDDPAVHQATRLALSDFSFGGRGLEILSACSAADALASLSRQPGIAVVLLDVVLETADAGLRVVEHIRKTIGNKYVRIVIRTGQPGYAPEERVALDYDIDDYREKTELTSAKLITAIRSALRAYRDISALDLNRRGLEEVSEATEWMFTATDPRSLVQGALERLESLTRLVAGPGLPTLGALACATEHGRETVIAATGQFAAWTGSSLAEHGDTRVQEAFRNAPESIARWAGPDGLHAVRLKVADGSAYTLCLDCSDVGRLDNTRFIELFLRNLGAALENAHLKRDLNREVAERREAVRNAELLARLPGELPEPVVRVAFDGTISYANAPGTAILGSVGAEVGDRLPAPWMADVRQAVALDKRVDFEFESAGRIYEMSFSPVREASYLNLFGRDVTDGRILLSRLEHAAFHDSLTGIPNRPFFTRSVERAVMAAKRYGGKTGLMILDLNHFKQLNDIWGHEAGDEALREIARRLEQLVRTTDVVARLGGDEFGIVVPRLGSVEELKGLAERIETELREPIKVGSHSWPLSCSIGLTTYPNDAQSADKLMRCADLAMYHAKRDGAGYRFYDSTIHQSVRLKTETELLLRDALNASSLEVFYQPIVRLADGVIVGCEALLRLRRSDGSIMLPDEFIGIAEETGLIDPIGYSVVQSVCEDIREWQELGLPYGSVAINVSARQFRDHRLTRRILDLMAGSSISPGTLEIEITESVLIGDEEAALAIMRELSDAGLTLTIDDFGTGYSSLSYLRRLPVSKLKIDRAFIADMLTDPDAAVITDAILGLGKSLKLKVVAEGIESLEQLEHLRQIGCVEGQGFYFWEPMPGPSFRQLLAETAAEASGRSGA